MKVLEAKTAAQAILLAQSAAACTFHPTSGRITEGGRQVRASSTQTCNTPVCSIPASLNVTAGRSVEPAIAANLFSSISTATGYAFTEATTYNVSTTYYQQGGTTGYISFIPTYNCWHGTFSDCFNHHGDDVYRIDPKMSFHACTPSLRSGGFLDGTFSFVYEQTN